MKRSARIETQNLARNCNEDLILAILHSGSKHGYQLAMEIEDRSGGYFRLNHGTLYPILHKLEKRKLIKGVWDEGDSGRRKKRYSITSRGRRYAAAQLRGWKEFNDRFFSIMSEIAE